MFLFLAFFERRWIMGSKALVLVSAFLLCFLISNNLLVAQSTDRNNPTPLQSSKIKGFSVAVSTVYWYKLTAGPGELAMEMEVDCTGGNYRCGISARFVLYDRDMQEIMNEALSIGDPRILVRKKGSLKLQNKQDLLLAIAHGKTASWNEIGGTYMIRFKGAIDLPSKIE